MNKISVKVSRTASSRDVPLPSYASRGSSGMDLRAAVDDPIIFAPGDIKLVPTGLTVAIPDGYEAQIRPRSGLALRHGIGMVNGPGTVDADYRGEIGVILVNWGSEPFTVMRGDRIAQMVIGKVYHAELEEVDQMDGTSRGSGGFGHTGLR